MHYKDTNMDLEYLLFLQNNVRSEALNPVMMGISDLVVSMYILFGLFVIYWCLSKKIGYSLLFAMAFGDMLNSIVKLSFCIYRPWIRNSAIVPPAVAIPSASGYSFPSGHSQISMSLYGTGAYWLWNNKRWIAYCLAVLILLIGFSRNYLGVHTPQDVIVGLLLGVYSIYLVHQLFKTYDCNDKKADLKLLGKGLLMSVLALLYFLYKNYPINYDAAGNILVDPEKMMKDGFFAIGVWSGFIIGWFIEKYYVNFSMEKPVWVLILRGIIGVVTSYCFMIFVSSFTRDVMNPCWRDFTIWFLMMLYVTAIYPALTRLTRL